MIVFDLRCGAGHVFEAWFGSSAGYEAQRANGLLACPLCGDDAVEKAVMAPNVGAKGNRAAPSETRAPAAIKAAMADLAKAQAKAIESSEWVGRAFANKARAMHDGEIAHAPIHGEVNVREAKALIEDGVQVAPLPFPVVPPNARN